MAYPYLLYKNVFDDGTPTATNTATGYDVLNIRDSRAYTYWKATGFGTLYLTVNAGSAKSCDTLGIFSHNLGTASASVSVEHSPDGAAWTEVLAAFTPTDDYAILKTFTSASKQYWRVKIVTAAVTPMLAICLLGARIEFPSKPLAPLSKYAIGHETVSTKSKSGHILGQQVMYDTLSMSFTFPPAESNYTWWSTTFKTFWDDHQLKPFFFCLDYTLFPADVFWVSLSASQKYALNMQFSTRVENFTLSMEGIAE